MKVFGSSGTRGVAITDLTPEFVLRVAKAAGTVWGTDRAAVATDTRETGQLFADAAAAGLASVGLDVDRLGETPTPAVSHYCETAGVPGILLTASHNPPEYNGVKLIGSDGIELSVDSLERIEEHVLTEEFDDATGRRSAKQPQSRPPPASTSSRCSVPSTARKSPPPTSPSRSTLPTARGRSPAPSSTAGWAVA